MSVLNVRDFPDDLHYKAKVAAAQRQESLREYVIRAIQREVERTKAEGSES